MSYENLLKAFKAVPKTRRKLGYLEFIDDDGERCAVGALATVIEARALASAQSQSRTWERTLAWHTLMTRVGASSEELSFMQRFADMDSMHLLRPVDRYKQVLAWLEKKVKRGKQG